MTDHKLTQLVETTVRPSFARCMGRPDDFFDDFYATLSEKAPGIGAMFAHVDMQQQNKLIRQGVEALISYASGHEESESQLRRVGMTHGKQGLNISPELYALWVDTLVETIREYDNQADDNTDAAWRVVARGGIELITSLY